MNMGIVEHGQALGRRGEFEGADANEKFQISTSKLMQTGIVERGRYLGRCLPALGARHGDAGYNPAPEAHAT